LLRRRIDFTVVAVQPSMTLQWQDELEAKFGLSFTIIHRKRCCGIAPVTLFRHQPLVDRLSFHHLASSADRRDPTSPACARPLRAFRSRALLILDEAHHAAPASGAALCDRQPSSLRPSGSAAPPRRRSGAPRGLAPAGSPAAKRRKISAPSSLRSRAAATAEGRPIDDDHYGAGIAFRFGLPDDPALERLFEAYRRRTGREPQKHFAIGDADAIVERIATFVAGGISKFILRPAARGDEELLAQTRRLIEEVLPRVAARWPKPAKHAALVLAAQGAA
jgi:hypothetical protein